MCCLGKRFQGTAYLRVCVGTFMGRYLDQGWMWISRPMYVLPDFMASLRCGICKAAEKHHASIFSVVVKVVDLSKGSLHYGDCQEWLKKSEAYPSLVIDHCLTYNIGRSSLRIHRLGRGGMIWWLCTLAV